MVHSFTAADPVCLSTGLIIRLMAQSINYHSTIHYMLLYYTLID